MAMTSHVAIDCEMVGGAGGENMAARVTLVNENGHVILDTYIKPPKPVHDYRTHISGITAEKLLHADPVNVARSKVANMIHGRYLVGHSLDADLDALGLSHPESLRRDLALYQPFKNLNGGQPASLKFLAERYLRRNIQSGRHCSEEDAKAAMDIFKQVRNNWY